MTVFVLYNFESKATSNYNEVLGVYKTYEDALRVMNNNIQWFRDNFSNKDYYVEEYEKGYYTEKNFPMYSIALVSNSNPSYYNAFRITEYEVSDYAHTAFVVCQEISVPDPKKCFMGDVYVTDDIEKAQTFIATDSKDTQAFASENFGHTFDDLDTNTEDDFYNYDEAIVSKDGYYIGWKLEEMDIKEPYKPKKMLNH